MDNKIDTNRVVQSFNELFGGDNNFVDKPEEVTTDAAKFFIEQSDDSQRAILDSVRTSEDQQRASLFDNKIIGSLLVKTRELNSEKTLRQLFLYCSAHSSDKLPPFVKITEAKSDKENPIFKEGKAPFEFIFFNVNVNGLTLPAIVSPNDLAGFKNPQFIVDGYIDSMLIITNSGSKVYQDEKMVYPDTVETEESKDSLLVVDGKEKKCGQKIEVLYIDSWWPKEFTEKVSPQLLESLDLYFSPDFVEDVGRNTIFPTALSNSDNVTFDINGYRLSFQHMGEKDLNDLGFSPTPNIAKFTYQGNTGLLLTTPSVENKIQTIDESIKQTRDLLGMETIKKVRITQSNTHRGMADNTDIGTLFITTASLKDSNAHDLAVTMRHEALHAITFSAGLTSDERIIFHAMESLGVQGNKPFLMGKKASHPFINFITEETFFNTEIKSGHPDSNIYEFCTSFTHTLFDMNNLQEKLKGLPTKQLSEFLDHYIECTTLFSNAATDDGTKKFFDLRNTQLINLRYLLEKDGILQPPQNKQTSPERRTASNENRPVKTTRRVKSALHHPLANSEKWQRRALLKIEPHMCFFLQSGAQHVKNSNLRLRISPKRAKSNSSS